MKFSTPMSMYEEYSRSSRKPMLIINKLDPPDNHNTRSTKIWNIITPNLKIFDYSVSISCLKSKLKSSLLANQHCHAVYDWTNKDFDICNLKNFVGSCRDST